MKWSLGNYKIKIFSDSVAVHILLKVSQIWSLTKWLSLSIGGLEGGVFVLDGAGGDGMGWRGRSEGLLIEG